MGVSGEQEARFELLYRAHYTVVSDYARRRVSEAAVDDVVAEVFAACWRHRADLHRVDVAWLLAAARNVVLHEYRSTGRQGRLSTKLEAHVPRDRTDPADRVAENLDNAAKVATAMQDLSEPDREVLRLVAWEQLSPKEIAVVVGCSQTAARVRVHRASRRLAAALSVDPTPAAVAGTPDPLRSAP